jgi:Na+-translocating ferredoxin:NAD+ oxidoreductase RnfD subunit
MKLSNTPLSYTCCVMVNLVFGLHVQCPLPFAATFRVCLFALFLSNTDVRGGITRTGEHLHPATVADVEMTICSTSRAFPQQNAPHARRSPSFSYIQQYSQRREQIDCRRRARHVFAAPNCQVALPDLHLLQFARGPVPRAQGGATLLC